MAAKRTSNHHDFRSTEDAVLSREPKHRAGGKPAALRSVRRQRHHRGCWASRFPTPRFPGERRDPETAELWTATKRTLNHHSLRGTGGAVLQESSSTVPAESPLR